MSLEVKYPQEASEGEKVTISAVAKVTGRYGVWLELYEGSTLLDKTNTVAVENDTVEGTLSFTMPNRDVTLTVKLMGEPIVSTQGMPALIPAPPPEAEKPPEVHEYIVLQRVDYVWRNPKTGEMLVIPFMGSPDERERAWGYTEFYKALPTPYVITVEKGKPIPKGYRVIGSFTVTGKVGSLEWQKEYNEKLNPYKQRALEEFERERIK